MDSVATEPLLSLGGCHAVVVAHGCGLVERVAGGCGGEVGGEGIFGGPHKIRRNQYKDPQAAKDLLSLKKVAAMREASCFLHDCFTATLLYLISFHLMDRQCDF